MDGGIYGRRRHGTPRQEIECDARSVTPLLLTPSSLRHLGRGNVQRAGMEQNGTKWNNLVFCRRPKARTANATNKQCPGYKVKLVFAEQKKTPNL